MKVFAFILASLTLFFATQTCCLDSEDHCEERDLSSQDCSDGTGEMTPCLPFFSCGACLGFIPFEFESYPTFFQETIAQPWLPTIPGFLTDFSPSGPIKPPSAGVW